MNSLFMTIFNGMVKKLSYLNIAFAIGYFVLFLLNSTSFAMVGILVVIIFNAVVLKHLEKEEPFKSIHFVIGATNIFFAGFMTLWVSHITLSSINHHYFGNSWFYIGVTSCFIISIFTHFILVIRKSRVTN
ncbi:MAG: hypothetical protein WKF66_02545 [Pedobacter sp.]